METRKDLYWSVILLLVIELPIRDGNHAVDHYIQNVGRVIELPIRDGNPSRPPH